MQIFQNNPHHPDLRIGLRRRNGNPQVLCLTKSKSEFCVLDIPKERSYLQNLLSCFLSNTDLQGCQAILNTAHHRIHSGQQNVPA